jgi:tripartite-type tricarboxylate transporter receptor subunit TctC
MKRPRRQFLRLAAGVVWLPAASRFAMAQTYPSRPVRIIVAAAAGGTTDITARLIGQWLTERLGQSFFVENRPGGNNNIGTEAVVRAPGDGYTLLLANSVNAINASLYERLSYNFVRDVAPVARISDSPTVMVVHPQFLARSVPEFIGYAKANPGKLNIGTSGAGTPARVVLELFKTATGLSFTRVDYRGGAPALADLLGQQVDVVFANLTDSLEYIRANRLQPLAIMSATRSPALPEIPVIGDFVPGLETNGWFGIVAPKATPTGIVERLNKEINAALADPTIKVRFADLGATLVPGSPAEFGKFIADDTEKWAKVIRAANIKLD